MDRLVRQLEALLANRILSGFGLSSKTGCRAATLLGAYPHSVNRIHHVTAQAKTYKTYHGSRLDYKRQGYLITSSQETTGTTTCHQAAIQLQPAV